jgi:thiol-disulfide isomerase/thioredoxin
VAAVVAGLAAALLAGCAGDPARQPAPPAPVAERQPAGESPLADCAALAAPPPKAPAAPEGAAGADLPAITLDCFTGGAAVPIGSLRGPAVVNLWATWCPPCQEELPVFQRLAERATDRVHVVGIDTMDDRAAAVSLADRLGLTFPSLVDPNREVLRAFSGAGLPMTLFIRGDGSVAHVYNAKALDAPALGALVEQHLGVTVDLA